MATAPASVLARSAQHTTGPASLGGHISGRSHSMSVPEHVTPASRQTKLVGPVRQQLCVVDSLVAQAQQGPVGLPDKRLDRLYMGTFSPAIDYLLMKRLRGPLMGVVFDDLIVDRFLADFGYAPAPGYNFITLEPAPAA